ncbi:RNA methyltransferase [Paenibacillus koleovorans]|uniref:RNA methyltransferase n=1 Tax=Paenibacillus koleovorans TaxID=121608 RepID=UPI001FEBE29A|nr:RNA methyltransferase [Paenibacillus koleovorans]
MNKDAKHVIPFPSLYAYPYACHKEEESLCLMELRALFGYESKPGSGLVVSERQLDPSRSPFVKMRIDVSYAATSLKDLTEQVHALALEEGRTFKVQYVKGDRSVSSRVDYEEERRIERAIGARVRGKAEMRRPDVRFGVLLAGDGRWLFGELRENEAVWLRHKAKPRPYSTALSARVARAVVNIAVPDPACVRAIDPCCGIGTVLVEALSMGIDIVGSDVNPLAVQGARVNLAHFGYADVVRVQDIREAAGMYDAAVLDLPYNLCSVLPEPEQLEMLVSVRRLAKRVAVVAIHPIEEALAQVGFRVTDRCDIRKGGLVRTVYSCE